ncbi:sugar phosphate isomerase/epimerase [Amycolatopsis acidicola]|uniref:Sugar phosphate isomerase/epimerase n=1 Tax=Amycolatopsis acidicola TaxID=2596893 RepID=A0A5N0V2Q9_9PSEU|nr:TIM barrel protein [Amycolatopsis acidicola]KAA9160719.1 sugar phosphate isomerase/epimerase [Amycolatopsis acidicola]
MTAADVRLGTPMQGVTLYSFTRDFHGRRYSFEDLVRKVAERGLGPGLEIVGFQSIRDFPAVTDEFVNGFKQLLADTGLKPSALGANADAYLRRDRALTDDEMVEYMRAQIEVAHRLGFPVLRVQYSVTPDDMERLLPVAEANDVRLGMEIHSKHSVRHPIIQALLERYEKLGSPYLGFIPDWGVSMRKVPRTLLSRFRAQGADEKLLNAIDEMWDAGLERGPLLSDAEIGAERQAFGDLARRFGGEKFAHDIMVNAAGLFGQQKPEDWLEVMKWTVHTHGKFYEIDEHGDEPSVPIREIMDVYLRAGYSGVISSEWEGFHFNDHDDAFDIIGKQQALLRRTAEELGSRLVTSL